MARMARVRSESGVYHIVLRGINKQTVFYDDEDQEVFLSRLKFAKSKNEFELYAFCFMGNHIHLLLREKEKAIGKIMQNILSSYVFWYNSKYERAGSLFQDRYKSEAINDDNYLLCAARYIHQNPLKAGLVENIAAYKWSSYSAYINNSESFVDKDFILTILQGKEQYLEFMNIIEEKKFLEPVEKIKISDNKLIKEIKNQLKITEISEIYALSKSDRTEKIKIILNIEGSNPYQVSRVCGIPMGVIRGISN